MKLKLFMILIATAALSSCKTGDQGQPATPPAKADAAAVEDDLIKLDGHPLEEITTFLADRLSDGGAANARADIQILKKEINFYCGRGGESCTVKRK